MKDLVVNDKTAAIVSVIEKVALDPAMDTSKMKDLLDMQERIFSKQAEMEWNAAMVGAQRDMPVVKPDRENTQTRSWYAQYETINKAVKPVYVANGFSLTFGQGETVVEGHIRITCDVAHIGGHTKRYFIDLPPDMEGIKGNQNKTAVHGAASAIKYGQRYLISLIFNITISGDDDGNAAGGDTRSALEVAQEHIDYISLVRDLWPSISAIKQSIVDKDFAGGVVALYELTKDEQTELWKAPTKGGIFSTDERAVIRSNEWVAARAEHFGKIE